MISKKYLESLYFKKFKAMEKQELFEQEVEDSKQSPEDGSIPDEQRTISIARQKSEYNKLLNAVNEIKKDIDLYIEEHNER